MPGTDEVDRLIVIFVIQSFEQITRDTRHVETSPYLLVPEDAEEDAHPDSVDKDTVELLVRAIILTQKEIACGIDAGTQFMVVTENRFRIRLVGSRDNVDNLFDAHHKRIKDKR